MSDGERHDPVTDVINLMAAPIAGGLRAVEQARKGADEMLHAVENLNRTLRNLNETTERINTLLEEFEEPIRASLPQLTRTIKTADEITQRLEAPVRAAAPNIELMMKTLSSPSFASLPGQMNEFVNIMGEISKRMGPLTQLAEGAGGMLLSGLKFPGMGGAKPAEEEDPAPKPAKKSTAKKSPAKKSTAKRRGQTPS